MHFCEGTLVSLGKPWALDLQPEFPVPATAFDRSSNRQTGRTLQDDVGGI